MSDASASHIIEESIEDLRTRLLDHSIYTQITGVGELRTFMQNHVFAVWDFMSLLKRLQQIVAGCDLPWLPPQDVSLARFVNEIVIGEESDEDGDGGFVCHFEMYRRAMDEIGADAEAIDDFIRELSAGNDIEDAVSQAQISEATREFVLFNVRLARDGKPHQVAAAFCYGREDIIPDMFQRMSATLNRQGLDVPRFDYYLKRHIELDGDQHGPLARRMVDRFCSNDQQHIAEAIQTARDALEARIKLWDGVSDDLKASGRDAA